MILLFSVLTFSGCSPIELDAQNLMKPPKLTSQQTEITNALESVLNNSDYNLKYPKSGDYRSAFVFFDIDNDNVDEALVFYALNSDSDNLTENTTRVNILDKTENGWRSVFEIPGLGNDVDSVSFAKINSTSKYDIIIGWNTLEEGEKKIAIYSFENNKLKTLFPGTTYTAFTIIDHDNDNLSELILFNRSDSKISSAKMIRKRNNRVSVSSDISLNGKVLSFSEISFGKLPDGQLALFVDEVIAPSTLATEVLVVKDFSMTNLMDEDSGSVFSSTRRNIAINSKDINDDGLIEIPYSSLMPGYKESQETEKQYQYTYCQMEGTTLIPVTTTAINKDKGYMIKYPSSWRGNITVKKQPETSEWSFVLFNVNLEQSTQELLKIRVYSQNDYKDNFELDKYDQIAKKGIFEYYAYIPKDVPKGLEINYDTLINEMFVLL